MLFQEEILVGVTTNCSSQSRNFYLDPDKYIPFYRFYEWTSNSPQEIKNQGIVYFVDPEYKVWYCIFMWS